MVHVDETLKLMDAIANDNDFHRIINDSLAGKEKMAMNEENGQVTWKEIFQRYKNKIIDEGREEGRKEGREEGHREASRKYEAALAEKDRKSKAYEAALAEKDREIMELKRLLNIA